MDIAARLRPIWPDRAPRSSLRGLDDLVAKLADPRRYERQIDRLHQRHLSDGGLWLITESGVGLGSVVLQRTKVARLLARSVSRGEYAIKPARLRTVRTARKDRTVFGYGLFDLIVHGVVADILTEAASSALSPALYSYHCQRREEARGRALTVVGERLSVSHFRGYVEGRVPFRACGVRSSFSRRVPARCRRHRAVGRRPGRAPDSSG